MSQIVDIFGIFFFGETQKHLSSFKQILTQQYEVHESRKRKNYTGKLHHYLETFWSSDRKRSILELSYDTVTLTSKIF